MYEAPPRSLPPALPLAPIRSRRFSNELEGLFAAAKALSCEVSDADLEAGCIYPPVRRIRETSVSIATATAEVAYRRHLATKAKPTDLRSFIESQMYQPDYQNYVGVASK